MISTAFSQKISLVDIVNSVDIEYSINSVYSFHSIFRFFFWLSFCLRMVFVGKCACVKHDTWHHGDISSDSLRVVTPDEVRFSDYDSAKNKNRKRKICLACRGKIVLEKKCSKLEEERASPTVCLDDSAPGNNFDDFIVDIPPFDDSIDNPSSCMVPSESKQVQVPDLPLRPYKNAEKRTQ